MDLHAWITQQVDEVEKRARDCDATDWRHVGPGIIVDRDIDGWQHAPDNALIVTVAHERIWWSTSPAHSPEADHIVTHSPEAVLRRCEADRRILARHRLAIEWTWAHEAPCHGCGTEGDCDDPVTENLNDCPELLDLGHAHGLTDEILASLDRPQAPERGLPEGFAYMLRITSYPAQPIATSDVPAALRGPHWKARHGSPRHG